LPPQFSANRDRLFRRDIAWGFGHTTMSLLESKRAWLALLIIGLLAIYLPGLQGELIFDDQRLADGTIFGNYGSLAEIKVRLLSYGSFVWIHDLFGDGWWKQRLANLLLHLGVTVCLYLLIRILVDQVQWRGKESDADPSPVARSKDAAVGFGVLVFAFNPVSVYAVGYLVERSIVMATLFSVVCLYLTARAAQGGGLGFLLGAAIAYVAALFSKEHAVMLPLVAFAVFLIVRRPSLRDVWLAGGVALLLFLSGAGVLAARYGAIVGTVFDASSQVYVAQLAALSPGIEDKVFLLSMINQTWLFIRYGLLWFAPYVGWMSVDLRPAFPLVATSFPQILGVPLYLGMAIGSVFLMARFDDWRRILGLGLFAPVVLFATEFATIWIQDPFVLYRSYIWAIGVPFLASIPFMHLKPRTIAITSIVLGSVLGALAVERVLSLKTESVAWVDAAEKIDTKAPANAFGRWRPLMNRGNQFFQRGLLTVALADYDAAKRLGDPTGLVDYHRGIVLQQLGHLEDALSAFSEAGKSKAMPQAFAGLPHFEKGKILFLLNRYGPAIAEIDQALQSMHDTEIRVTAFKIRAQCNIRTGRTEDAVADYKQAVEISPANRSTRIGLALALSGNKQSEAALAVLNSLQSESDGWDVRFGRAMVFEAMGLPEKAREEARTALSMNPGDSMLQGFARKHGLKP
jgi:protein O-mannosyl-transferase